MAGQQLLAAHPELTAVIGGNDLVALGVMRAAIEAGRRIPENLALIGGVAMNKGLVDSLKKDMMVEKEPEQDWIAQIVEGGLTEEMPGMDIVLLEVPHMGVLQHHLTLVQEEEITTQLREVEEEV